MAKNIYSQSLIVDQWLHARPATTCRRYRQVVGAFLSECSDPSDISVGDVTGYLDRRPHLAPATRNTAVAAIKSYLRYAHEAGAIPRDVGRLVRSEQQRDRLSERIIGRDRVLAMIEGESDPRNRALLMLLYYGGLRIAEVCGLTWTDVVPRHEASTLTVYGKGAKVRYVPVPPLVYRALVAVMRTTTDDRVFALSARQASRIVKHAAIRCGLPASVSPHWLRHCHASHALDAGAPIHLVQATLGHASVATTSRYLHSNPQDSSARYLGV